jgi:hypothetical protein
VGFALRKRLGKTSLLQKRKNPKLKRGQTLKTGKTCVRRRTALRKWVTISVMSVRTRNARNICSNKGVLAFVFLVRRKGMKFLNRLGLFTRKDLKILEGILLRHSVQVVKIADHALLNGYQPPIEIAPYQNRRYHIDRLKAVIRMKAPAYARMMNL